MSGHVKEAGILTYLLEELGDARLRCEQLKRYVDQAQRLIANSTQKDHVYEVAGDLLYSIPDTLMRLDKALDATALAASRLDYEELKQALRPEKVQELEQVLQDVRIRSFDRVSSQEIGMSENQSVTLAAGFRHIAALLERQDRQGVPFDLPKLSAAVQSILDAAKHQSRFEEGVPADPTKNMDPDDALKWKAMNDKYQDQFKAAAHSPGFDMIFDTVRDLALSAQRKMSSGQYRLAVWELAKIVSQVGVLMEVLDLQGVGLASRLSAALVRGRSRAQEQAKTVMVARTEEARFEEGVPADPTKNMDPDDALKWKAMNDKYQDKLKG